MVDTLQSFKFFQSMEMGHMDTCKRLITQGRVPVTITDTSNGWSALFYAIRHGYNEFIDFLIMFGNEDTLLAVDLENNTALMIAVMYDNMKAFSMIIYMLPNLVRKKNIKGETALIIAAKAGNVKMVEELIKYGADCDSSDSEGNTPLHYAAQWGHVAIITLLIKNDCKFTQHNKLGWTPLDYAFNLEIAHHLQTCARILFEEKKKKKPTMKRFPGLFEE